MGARAYSHPAVRSWWEWLLTEYKPRYPVALVTPCSNVKPYTRSPTSRKIRGLLRRLGAWDGEAGRPERLEWLYLSDLLVLVPYERAEAYPACCYEVPPEVAVEAGMVGKVAEVLAAFMERGFVREAVVFLPRSHMALWLEARGRARRWPREHIVPYTIYRLDRLARALQSVLAP